MGGYDLLIRAPRVVLDSGEGPATIAITFVSPTTCAGIE